MSINIKEITKISDLIEEVNEIVGIWEIWIEDCPVNPIKVKVFRDTADRYMGITNYYIKNPKQFTPYRSEHTFETILEALRDAIFGFLMFYKPELKDQTEFEKDKNF